MTAPLLALRSWLPLLTSPGVLWGLVVLTFVVASLHVLRRRRARLDEMALEEKAEEAAQRILSVEEGRESDDVSDESAGPGDDGGGPRLLH